MSSTTHRDPVDQTNLSPSNPDAELMSLIDQLWAFAPEYKKVQASFNVAETAYLSGRKDQAAEAPFTEAEAVHDAAWNVIKEFERKMFATEAHSLAGVKAKARWYVQFYCQGDLEQIDGSFDNVTSLFRELISGSMVRRCSAAARPHSQLCCRGALKM
jgi:hypothetical protein